MKKHEIIEVYIERINYPDTGFGKYEDKKVKIKHVIPGQTVRARVKRSTKNAEAVLVEIAKRAENEIEPVCASFSSCGGCAFQSLRYCDELALKDTMLRRELREAGFENAAFDGLVPAPCDFEYRNKMEFTFGDITKGGGLSLGMRRRNSYYEVSDASCCNLVNADFRLIVSETVRFFQKAGEAFYHRGRNEGSLRNLIVRGSTFANELMVNIVTTPGIKTDMRQYAGMLASLPFLGKLVSVLHTENLSCADSVKPDKTTVLFGSDFFSETLLGLSFKISPFSFFQTNSRGAEQLYSTVREFLGDSHDKTIFDLYCGTGTIAQIAAQSAKKVIGIEIVGESVSVARENALRNGLSNCEFIAGDVLRELNLVNDKPDIIILDPPREGIHPGALPKLLAYEPDTIVYISCKLSSLGKDISFFAQNGYAVERIRAHDMFPKTPHVETVVLLSKLKSTNSIEVKINLDEMDLTKSESKATYDEIKAICT